MYVVLFKLRVVIVRDDTGNGGVSDNYAKDVIAEPSSFCPIKCILTLTAIWNTWIALKF